MCSFIVSSNLLYNQYTTRFILTTSPWSGRIRTSGKPPIFLRIISITYKHLKTSTNTGFCRRDPFITAANRDPLHSWLKCHSNKARNLLMNFQSKSATTITTMQFSSRFDHHHHRRSRLRCCRVGYPPGRSIAQDLSLVCVGIHHLQYSIALFAATAANPLSPSMPKVEPKHHRLSSDGSGRLRPFLSMFSAWHAHDMIY